jgi:hypothetical protein
MIGWRFATFARSRSRIAACAFPTPTVTVTGQAPVELPFRIAADGLILLTGHVNGAQDVDFILDTGAPVTVLIANAHTRGLRLDTNGARRLGDDPASPTGVIRGGQSIDFGRVSIGGLTAVDGATVLNDRYEVLAFGAKIWRPEGRPPVEKWVITEPIVGNVPMVVHPTEHGGTRHFSAAQFVQDQRDSLSLVASQDGRFTVFAWSPCENMVHAHRVESLLM